MEMKKIKIKSSRFEPHVLPHALTPHEWITCVFVMVFRILTQDPKPSTHKKPLCNAFLKMYRKHFQETFSSNTWSLVLTHWLSLHWHFKRVLRYWIKQAVFVLFGIKLKLWNSFSNLYKMVFVPISCLKKPNKKKTPKKHDSWYETAHLF